MKRNKTMPADKRNAIADMFRYASAADKKAKRSQLRLARFIAKKRIELERKHTRAIART